MGLPLNHLRNDQDAHVVNPFKVYGLLAIIFTSVCMAVTGKSPITLQESLSYSGQVIWAVCAIVGALNVLVGVFWPDHSDGQLIETPGLVLIGFIVATYGLAVLMQIDHWYATLAGPLALAFGLACWHRVFQIYRLRRHAVAWARAQREAHL